MTNSTWVAQVRPLILRRLRDVVGSEHMGIDSTAQLQIKMEGPTGGEESETIQFRSWDKNFANFAKGNRDRFAEKGIIVTNDVTRIVIIVAFTDHSEIDFLPKMVNLAKLYSLDWSRVRAAVSFSGFEIAGEDYYRRFMGDSSNPANPEFEAKAR